MSYNYFGLVCFVFSLVAFFAAFKLFQDRNLLLRILALVIATLAALPGLSFSFYYTHLLQETEWYYQFRSLRFSELCIIPIGIAGGIFASLIPRILLIAPLLAVALAAFVPFAKPILRPLKIDSKQERWIDDLCLQSTQSTCGPASLATILKSLGIDEGISESKLARQAHTYAGGTEAWYLARIARNRGADAKFRFQDKGLSTSPNWPAIIGVKVGHIGHFITILDYDSARNLFLVGDPFRTKKWLSPQQLESIYSEFTGFYLEISKAE